MDKSEKDIFNIFPEFNFIESDVVNKVLLLINRNAFSSWNFYFRKLSSSYFHNWEDNVTVPSVHSTTFKGLRISTEPNQTKIHIGKKQFVWADSLLKVHILETSQKLSTNCVSSTLYTLKTQ